MAEGNMDDDAFGAALDNPAASFALKAVVRAWRSRDPVDAAHDAEWLARVMAERAQTRTGQG